MDTKLKIFKTMAKSRLYYIGMKWDTDKQVRNISYGIRNYIVKEDLRLYLIG